MLLAAENAARIVEQYPSLLGVGLLAILGVWRTRKRARDAKVAALKLESVVRSGLHEPATLHPEINPDLCAGCGACTKVCPEGDILKMIDHRAVLVSPLKCVGHGECEAACPTGAISLVFGTKTRGMEIPRISSNFETNVKGIYIAGELGGMGLIRNAVRQGRMAAEDACQTVVPLGKKADCEILIVGAGPAGLAAALTVIERSRSYIVIDNNTFGGTIASFPRQKVVMSHPVELPIVGVMKFKTNRISKEELMAHWATIRSQTGLQIREKTKFENLKLGSDGVFTVSTTKGTIRAQKIVLCMGVRGSPRKLGVPGEELTKVTYNLLDPEQYQRQRVAVVGSGNAGTEAAQYLGKAQYGNQVTMLVRGPDFDRCNEENKEIVLKMAKAGRVDLWYNSSVKAVTKDQIVVERDGKETLLPNDFIFIFAGAEIPYKLLMSFGIEIDKKFGEALKRA